MDSGFEKNKLKVFDYKNIVILDISHTRLSV